MSVKSLTAADISHNLTLLSTEIASNNYKQRHPNASDDEALAWGTRNRILFVCEAIDTLTSTVMGEAHEASGRPRQ